MNNSHNDQQASSHNHIVSLLAQLDTMFTNHAKPEDIETLLTNELSLAQTQHDQATELTILNELMGLYRSQGLYEKNAPIIQNSLALIDSMHLDNSDAATTTLINVATSLRAAQQYKQAQTVYQRALTQANLYYQPNDRRLAALHNNLSMLYSETGKLQQALEELTQALTILEHASVEPDTDIDIAATHTNIALIILQLLTQHEHDNSQNNTQTAPILISLHDACEHAKLSVRMYRNGKHEDLPHFASALAGLAQVQCAQHDYPQAVENYQQALHLIKTCYGEQSDSYMITKSNLEYATTLRDKHHEQPPKTSECHNIDATPPQEQHKLSDKHYTGLQIAQLYWQTYGTTLLDNDIYRPYRDRIAVGLVGHGSECYGFDDEISQDHDFGAGFCLWLTNEDYDAIGKQLQHDYAQLPTNFLGYATRVESVRVQQGAQRVGVFRIDEFFTSITGLSFAPSDTQPHLWLSLDEPTLAAATNGKIFADPLGAFSKRRQGFKLMPDDVRYALISRRLGMMAQSGQYNVARMLQRHDGAAAWMSIHEFVSATASLVFLLNNPISVGYLPYYKWQFAALRRLSKRLASRLPQVCALLERLVQLASAACFGGAEFGEGGKGSKQARTEVTNIIETVCFLTVQELQAQGLSNSTETFLEWQRPYIEAHIRSQAACLHSI